MTDAMPILMIVGFVVIAAVAIAASLANQKRLRLRREALFVLAPQLGLTLYPDGLSSVTDGGFWEVLTGQASSENSSFLDQFQGFAPFGRGHSHAVKLLMTGRRGEIDWALMDYQYKVTTSNGKTTTTVTYNVGVVAAKVPLAMPQMSLTEENFFNRIGEWVGRREMKTESTEFNDRYFIQTNDEKASYDLLHPQMIEYLMGLPIRFWQMGGTWILLHQSSLYEPQDFVRAMEEIEGFWSRIPAFVREDRGWITAPPKIEGGIS